MSNSRSAWKPEQWETGAARAERDAFGLVWLFAVIAPLLTILFNYIFQKWWWGLMDDLAILNSGAGIIDRFRSYYVGLCAWGVFRPLYVLHSSVAYTLFERVPRLFYIFRLFEICVVLYIWGICACRVTKQKVAVILVPAVTLSFHYFYDAFFYLSSQEIIGLFFVGLSLFFYLRGLENVLAADPADSETKWHAFKWKSWFVGLFFLLCAFGAKETFISCGVALGLSYFFLAWSCRKTQYGKSLFMAGLSLVVISVLFALSLTLFIKSGYTAGYSLSDMTKLSSNLTVWFKKDFMNHGPWVVAAGLIFYMANKKRGMAKALWDLPLRVRWAFFLGVLFYLGFLSILLPWNTVSYYATPLGLFFAFIVAVIISDGLPRLSGRWQIFFVVCALGINQLVCQYALTRESTYQYDTHNIMEWLKSSDAILGNRDVIVASNAMEPAASIPGLMRQAQNVDVQRFHWLVEPEGLVDGKQCDFYLYGPRFHHVRLQNPKDWKVVFLSKNWVMFERVKKENGV